MIIRNLDPLGVSRDLYGFDNRLLLGGSWDLATRLMGFPRGLL